MVQNKVYIALVSLLFITFAVVLNFFPRSAWSALEKRDLARFPEFTLDSLFSGAFTTSVNSWYSDTEPYRDRFMALSMKEKDLLRIVLGDDNVTFHAANGPVEEGEDAPDNHEMDERNVGEYHNNLTADENAKIAHNGIIIVGSGPTVRALMAYGGSSRGGVQYAEAANAYKRAFGSAVNPDGEEPQLGAAYLREEIGKRMAVAEHGQSQASVYGYDVVSVPAAVKETGAHESKGLLPGED